MRAELGEAFLAECAEAQRGTFRGGGEYAGMLHGHSTDRGTRFGLRLLAGGVHREPSAGGAWGRWETSDATTPPPPRRPQPGHAGARRVAVKSARRLRTGV